MATLGQIRNELVTVVCDAPSEITSLFTTYVQRAQEELESTLVAPGMETEEVFVTTEDERELGDIPADALSPFRLTSLPWVHEGTGETHTIRWGEAPENLVRAFNHLDAVETGPPETVLVDEEAGKLYVDPKPDGLCPTGDLFSDGEYRVHVPYVRGLASLDQNPDTNWWSEHASEFLKEWAAHLAFLDMKDRTEAGLRRESARSLKKRLRRKLRTAALPAAFTLSFGLDAHGATGRRRAF